MIERPAHTASLVAAVLAGFVSSIRQPATAQFEDITRALGWTGPLLAPLAMLYSSAITLAAMALAYALLRETWRRLNIHRQAGGSHSGPSS